MTCDVNLVFCLPAAQTVGSSNGCMIWDQRSEKLTK